MRARRPQARFAMLSTAWSRTDPFWTAWTDEHPSWIRLKATADVVSFPAEFLEQERRALGEHAFNREYLGVPGGGEASPFTWELYERATHGHVPLVPAGPAFNHRLSAAFRSPTRFDQTQQVGRGRMTFNRNDPATWPYFKPTIIAHDVGRTRDRSTAVIGGNGPFEPRLLGIAELEELPQGLYGSARASALATVDRRHGSNALIIADLSNDATYAEVLYEIFGARVIGVQITRHGDGSCFERRPVKNGVMLVYTVGRTYLLELYQSELQSDLVRIVDSPTSRRAYAQLVALETELRETGIIHKCAPGQHDDLGISCAMLAWAARHPHLNLWVRDLLTPRRPARPREKFNWAGCT
jgi:hypothetical protein